MKFLAPLACLPTCVRQFVMVVAATAIGVALIAFVAIPGTLGHFPGAPATDRSGEWHAS